MPTEHAPNHLSPEPPHDAIVKRWDTCEGCKLGLLELGAVAPPGPHVVAFGRCDVHRDEFGLQATHVVHATGEMVARWKALTPPAPRVDRWLQRHALIVAELAAGMLGTAALRATPADIEHAVSQARLILVEAAKGGDDPPVAVLEEAKE